MLEKPVNQIDLDSNIIKANDVNSVINIKITDVNNNPVNLENEIEYFYLVRNNKYYPVTDISFNNDVISFKLPNLYKGLYKIEIKDKQGSIYPANDDISILLNQSFESGKESEFINMKDSILKDVPDILNDYITENEEKFKGKDGKDGEDGKDGIDGAKGDPGDKGEKGDKGDKGDPGEKGADGKMNFEELTEEQIASLKGEKGDKGDKGDPGERGEKGDPGIPGKDGGFNGEKIGVNNLIDISKLTPRNGSYTYDLEKGVINYDNIEWYLSQYIVLNGVKHVFRIEDFLSNPNYSSGRINLQLLDSDNKIIINKFVTSKEIVEVDLTGRDRQEYWVQLRVTNTTLFSGFIEKPMLVEGDIPVLWSPSEVDKNTLFKDNHVTGRFYKSEITNDNSYQNLSIFNFSGSPDVKVNGYGLEFEEGIYMFTNSLSIEQDDGIMNLNFRLNGSSELIESFEVVNSHSTSHVLKVNKGDVFDLRVSYNGSNPGTQQTNRRNGFTITKLR